jgi:hypothetical protein
MLHSLHIVSLKDETVCLAYYFGTPAAGSTLTSDASGGASSEAGKAEVDVEEEEGEGEWEEEECDEDAWEAALEEETRVLWGPQYSTSCVATTVRGRVVAVITKGDAVFLLSGNLLEDELSLASHVPALVALVTGVCEDRLTPAQITSFHGKIVQCLHEAYPRVSWGCGFLSGSSPSTLPPLVSPPPRSLRPHPSPPHRPFILQGMRRSTNVAAVLRAAKLKAVG